MAPPSAERDNDVCVYVAWAPEVHAQCYAPQRRAIELVLAQCAHRTHHFGTLPLELTLQILRRVPVCVVIRIAP